MVSVASRRLLIAAIVVFSARIMHAQATPTAAERLQLSTFAGASGVYTGLDNGRNLSLTAGVDLALRPFFHVNPAVEVRGMYPVNNGKVDNERNILGGLRFGGTYRRLHPYVDILFGRGEIRYTPPVYSRDYSLLYVQTTSNIISPGAGAELDLTPHFALRGDVQLQRYATPVTASGHLYATPITGALTYRFNFNRHAIGRRH